MTALLPSSSGVMPWAVGAAALFVVWKGTGVIVQVAIIVAGVFIAEELFKKYG